jgi:hypothetical protein
MSDEDFIDFLEKAAFFPYPMSHKNWITYMGNISQAAVAAWENGLLANEKHLPLILYLSGDFPNKKPLTKGKKVAAIKALIEKGVDAHNSLLFLQVAATVVSKFHGLLTTDEWISSFKTLLEKATQLPVEMETIDVVSKNWEALQTILKMSRPHLTSLRLKGQSDINDFPGMQIPMLLKITYDSLQYTPEQCVDMVKFLTGCIKEDLLPFIKPYQKNAIATFILTFNREKEIFSDQRELLTELLQKIHQIQ